MLSEQITLTPSERVPDYRPCATHDEQYLSNAGNGNLIDRTIETWQPRLDRNLSREDARQIVENVTGFFSILTEWSLAKVPEPANGVRNAGEKHGEACHVR